MKINEISEVLAAQGIAHIVVTASKEKEAFDAVQAGLESKYYINRSTRLGYVRDAFGEDHFSNLFYDASTTYDLKDNPYKIIVTVGGDLKIAGKSRTLTARFLVTPASINVSVKVDNNILADLGQKMEIRASTPERMVAAFAHAAYDIIAESAIPYLLDNSKSDDEANSAETDSEASAVVTAAGIRFRSSTERLRARKAAKLYRLKNKSKLKQYRKKYALHRKHARPNTQRSLLMKKVAKHYGH